MEHGLGEERLESSKTNSMHTWRDPCFGEMDFLMLYFG
jgi:hypothetical protein